MTAVADGTRKPFGVLKNKWETRKWRCTWWQPGISASSVERILEVHLLLFRWDPERSHTPLMTDGASAEVGAVCTNPWTTSALSPPPGNLISKIFLKCKLATWSCLSGKSHWWPELRQGAVASSPGDSPTLFLSLISHTPHSHPAPLQSCPTFSRALLLEVQVLCTGHFFPVVPSFLPILSPPVKQPFTLQKSLSSAT